MRVTITLRGTLTQYLPPGSGRHSRPLEVAEEATIDALLDHLEIPRELTHLVLLNGVQIPFSELATTRLGEQDTLAVWPPLSGG